MRDWEVPDNPVSRYEEPRGLLSDLPGRIFNPVTMMGLGMLSASSRGRGIGEGLFEGAQAGLTTQAHLGRQQREAFNLQKMQREFAQKQERDAQFPSLLKDPDLLRRLPPGAAGILAAAGPDTAAPLLVQDALRHKDTDAEREKTAAQIELLRAQAQFARSRATLNGSAVMMEPPADPLAGYGLDDQNRFVDLTAGRQRPTAGAGLLAPDALPGAPSPQAEPAAERGADTFGPGGLLDPARVENRVLGSASEKPPETSRAHQDWGGYGTVTTQVPGLVLRPSGMSDKYGTEKLEGQRAIDSQSESYRKNYLDLLKTQQLWTAVYGKPKAGYMYGRDGSEVPKGPLKKYEEDNARQDRILTDQLQRAAGAKDTILNTNGMGRALAPVLDRDGLNNFIPVGRLLNRAMDLEKTAQAFTDYEEAVMQPIYALSGKQITKHEMDRFRNVWMPKSGDSDSRIAEKHARLETLMRALQGAQKKGMPWKQALSYAEDEASKSREKDKDPPVARPEGDRIRSKYHGLE